MIEESSKNENIEVDDKNLKDEIISNDEPNFVHSNVDQAIEYHAKDTNHLCCALLMLISIKFHKVPPVYFDVNEVLKCLSLFFVLRVVF